MVAVASALVTAGVAALGLTALGTIPAVASVALRLPALAATTAVAFGRVAPVPRVGMAGPRIADGDRDTRAGHQHAGRQQRCSQTADGVGTTGGWVHEPIFARVNPDWRVLTG